jgi:NADPH:quinone reductase-like Zn-dependent oxidoreductase
VKVYRVRSFTGESGLEQLEEADPTAPVARQVLVRIRANSLNFRDSIALDGHMQFVPPGMAKDHIPLCDGAGEVVAVGPDVTRLAVGDRVAFTFHPGWIAGPIPSDLNILGRSSGPHDGLLADYSKVDESELVKLPDQLSFEEGATLCCAGVTAWYALFGPAGLVPGEEVLVMGTGGVALFALQFAKMAGARVIATTTSPSKMSILRKLGADAVVDASNGPGWHEGVLEATDGRGVDVTVEVGGGGTWPDSGMATRNAGRMSLVGALSQSREDIPSMFMRRGIHSSPTRVGSRLHFEQMNRAIALHNLHPIIDRTFVFDDAKAAFAHFRSGARVGKVVISNP